MAAKQDRQEKQNGERGRVPRCRTRRTNNNFPSVSSGAKPKGLGNDVVAEACDHSRDDDNNSAQPLLVLPQSV